MASVNVQGVSGSPACGSRKTLFAAVYADGSAAFGQLSFYSDTHLCPRGTWLPNFHEASGFHRKGGGSDRIVLRTVKARGTPVEQTGKLSVSWFQPVAEHLSEEAVWALFQRALESVKAQNGVDSLRARLEQVTLDCVFGGIDATLEVCIDDRPVRVEVVGVAFDPYKLVYQIESYPDDDGVAGQPVALMRGWGDPPNRCRVIFSGQARESFETSFKLA